MTGNFQKNVFLLLKRNITKLSSKTWYHIYLPLLQDNAPAHKACIVTQYLGAKEKTVLPHPCFLHIYPCMTSSGRGSTAECYPNLNSTYVEKNTNHKMASGLQFISLWWVSLLRNIKMLMFPKVYWSSRKMYMPRYFEGREQIKGSKINKCGWKQPINITIF